MTRTRVSAPVTRDTRDLGAIKRQVCVHMTALDMASACTKEAVKLWAVGFADVNLSGWVPVAKIIDARWTVPSMVSAIMAPVGATRVSRDPAVSSERAQTTALSTESATPPPTCACARKASAVATVPSRLVQRTAT